ncbi:hypothetical protein L195_g050124, partial [Trifolium pratense]
KPKPSLKSHISTLNLERAGQHGAAPAQADKPKLCSTWVTSWRYPTRQTGGCVRSL